VTYSRISDEKSANPTILLVCW